MRQDQHRPSAIIPADYEFVAQEFLKIESIGDCAILKAERAAIQAHMKRTGGSYSRHEHGGNCMVCGSVNAIYTVLFYHFPTNTYVRMGSDCARKCEMGGDFDSNAFRAAIEDARQAQAGKRKAQAILSDEKLETCWQIWLDSHEPLCSCEYKCNCYYVWERNHKEERTIADIVAKLVKYGSLSEAQIKFLHTLVNRISTRAEKEAQQKAEREAAEDCPSGKVKITGTVVKLDYQENDWGGRDVWTIKDDRGFLVWGSQPTMLHGENGGPRNRGDRVSFVATVTQSASDSKFGFYKRPAKAQMISQTEERRS